MSRQNGVSPSLASTLETTTQGTLSTTTSPQPSASTFEGHPANLNRPSSIDSSSDSSHSANIIRKKVQIPKLSAATTALLARITGNIRGGQQRNDTFTTGWNASTFDPSLNDLNFQWSNTMKASSTILELPTAPFVYANNTLAPAPVSCQTPTVSPEYQAGTRKPVAIAPRPTATLPTGPSVTLVANTQIQPTPASQPPVHIPKAPLAPLALKAPNAPAAQPQKVSAGSRSRKPAAKGTKKGKKRRRGDDSDGEIIRAGDSSSDESNIAPTATQTKSGRQVNRPSLYVPPASPAVVKANGTSSNGSDTAAPRKRRRVYRKTKDANINCIHCQRGHSPTSNAIVFCDGCNRAWHQLCHDPPIESEVVAVTEKEWHCRECKPVPISIVQPTVVRSNPELQARLSGPPIPHPPALPPKIEAGGELFSAEERRGYLSSLSHASLVELLMTISDKNPTIPMFPSDLKTLRSSQFFFQTNTSAAPVSEAPVETSAAEKEASTEKPDAGNTKDSLPSASSSRTRRRYESDEESEYEEFQEHRLYPRAGNGFRLSLNADDIDILGEDPACPTFSYALHGPAKARAEANQRPPVWGTT